MELGLVPESYLNLGNKEMKITVGFYSSGQIHQNTSWQPHYRLEPPLLENENDQDVFVYSLPECELATVSFDDIERPLCKLTLNWASFSDYGYFVGLNKFSDCFSDCSVHFRQCDRTLVYHQKPTLKLDDAFVVDSFVCEQSPTCDALHNIFLISLERHITCVDSTVHNLCHQQEQPYFVSTEFFSWR